jgi:hypothetical protein
MSTVLRGVIDEVSEGKKGVNGVNFSLRVDSGSAPVVSCLGRILVPDFDLSSGQRVSVKGSRVLTTNGSPGHFQVEAISAE